MSLDKRFPRGSTWTRWFTIPIPSNASQLFGAQRVAFGSDYPFPLGEAQPGQLIKSIKELLAKDKAQLLSGTVREFLGL